MKYIYLFIINNKKRLNAMNRFACHCETKIKRQLFQNKCPYKY